MGRGGGGKKIYVGGEMVFLASHNRNLVLLTEFGGILHYQPFDATVASVRGNGVDQWTNKKYFH